MDLIHIERTQVADADRQLRLALERRNKAADRCVDANHQAASAKAVLLRRLAECLKAGTDVAALRNTLLGSGINASIVSTMLEAARHGSALT
jgi:hypothetical protein